MATYCRCGVEQFGVDSSLQGLCPECYPLSKTLAEREDADIDKAKLAATKPKNYHSKPTIPQRLSK